MWRTWILAAGTFALATSACTRSERGHDKKEVTRSTRAEPMEPQKAPTTQGDDAILAVLGALNQGEIDQATTALTKLTSSDARAFAQHMVAEHTTAAAQASQVAAALGVVPRDNDVVEQLKASSDAVVQSLTAANASAVYDRMYMQSQVDGHENALKLLNSNLLPSASDTRTRTLLEAVRGTVQEHLRTAQGTLQALPTS